MCKTFDLEAMNPTPEHKPPYPLESPSPSPAPRRKPTFHLMSAKLEEGQAEEGQPLTPCVRAACPPAAVPGWKKWGALFIFALQSAGSVLLMRYSKLQHGPAYSNLAAVMMQELVKLGVSTVSRATRAPRPLSRVHPLHPLHPLPRPPHPLPPRPPQLLYANECRGVGAMVSALRVDLRDNAVEWLQLAVPALLYTVQNVMLFVGAAHLEAAIAQARAVDQTRRRPHLCPPVHPRPPHPNPGLKPGPNPDRKPGLSLTLALTPTLGLYLTPSPTPRRNPTPHCLGPSPRAGDLGGSPTRSPLGYLLWLYLLTRR